MNNFEGVIAEKGIEAIEKLIEKFRNRGLSFIKDDNKTIKELKEDQKSGELKRYKSYVKDKNLKILMRMGLVLRKIEERGEGERIEQLREKIYRKFGSNGRHVVYIVQSGILNKYVSYLEVEFQEESLIRERLLKFLNDTHKHICFVNNLTPFNLEEHKIRITTIINAHSPEVFVISGMGSAAENAEKLISETDNLNLKEYEREDHSAENRRIAFFHKRLR